MIVTVTLNAGLHVDYSTGDATADGSVPISRPVYRAGGRGVTVARVLRAFGHDVLAAGLAGGACGELIIQDLARSGVPTAFTMIRGESRRFFRFADPDNDGPALRFRHELVRMAVEAGIAPHRKTELHACLLAALEERGDADPALLAHHAEGAGAAKAVLRYAPEAARRSSVIVRNATAPGPSATRWAQFPHWPANGMPT